MFRKLGPIVMLIAIVSLLGAAAAFAGDGKTVSTRGDEVLSPNKFVRTDLRFSPGPVHISTGETVTWEHADKTDAPHTVTIASADQLVQNFADFLLGTCPACDAAAGAALDGHFAMGPPVIELVAGGAGFGDVGDSVLFFEGESFTKEIDAEPGSTLFYFCAIHPWMQGTIEVAG